MTLIRHRLMCGMDIKSNHEPLAQALPEVEGGQAALAPLGYRLR